MSMRLDTGHPVALERERKLDKVGGLRAAGATLELALNAVDFPRSTYYDWCKALERGVRGLVPKSRRSSRLARPR